MSLALILATWKFVASPTGIRLGMQLSEHWAFQAKIYRVS